MAFDFACPDWEQRLEQGRAPIPDLDLDPVAAAEAVDIYNNLRLPDVKGQPLLEDAGAEWFRDLVRAAFGSADPETGENRVGEIFCLVPKKNSKTTNAAAFGLTALLMNEVRNAEMYIVGPTKEVADTCFSQAKGMIDADDVDPDTGESYLKNRFWVRDNDQEIVDRWTETTLKILAFDARVLTGKIPLLVILDELHVIGKNPKAENVLAELRGGMITRPDALMLTITTQSDEPPTGVFKKELEYARKVRDGKVTGADVNLLPCLFEFPEAIQASDEKPWRDPKLWPMVLPNLGLSITLPRLMRLYRAAVEKGADTEVVWASKHLNIQVGIGLFTDRWVGVDLWPGASEPMTIDDLLAQSDCATVGIDGGGLDDLLGLAVIGRHAQTRRWHVWARAWVQPVVLKERRKDIATRLQDFAAQGDLVICDDPTQDLREVAAICAKVRDAGLLPEKHGIGLDPAGVTAIVDELAADGMEGDLLTAISQGFRLQPAIKGVERKLNDGTLAHCGQDMLTWCVSNARTEQRGNAEMITKQVAGKAKIDPLIGVFNAAMLMSRNPVAASGGGSAWNDPDFSLFG